MQHYKLSSDNATLTSLYKQYLQKVEKKDLKIDELQERIEQEKENKLTSYNRYKGLQWYLNTKHSFDHDLTMLFFPIELDGGDGEGLNDKCGFTIFNNSGIEAYLSNTLYNKDFGIDYIKCSLGGPVNMHEGVYGWLPNGKFVFAKENALNLYNYYEQKLEDSYTYDSAKYSIIQVDNDFGYYLLKGGGLYEVHKKDEGKVYEFDLGKGVKTVYYDRINDLVIFLKGLEFKTDEKDTHLMRKIEIYTLDLKTQELKEQYITKAVKVIGRGCRSRDIVSKEKGVLRLSFYGCSGSLEPQNGDEFMVENGAFEIKL